MRENHKIPGKVKIAIVFDWLVSMRGGEKVLESLCEMYPDADIFTLVCDKKKVSERIRSMNIKTSLLQKTPFAKKYYRYYLPIMPLLIKQYRLNEYGVVLSVSHCTAKSVRTKALHICYCLTPMRYAYDMFDDYFANTNMLAKAVFRVGLNLMKKWDIRTSNRPDYYITTSKFVQARIKKFYNRDSHVIYPFVDTKFFNINNDVTKKEYYLIVSALVPYKKIDLAIDAFNDNGKELLIIGDGYESYELKKKARSNIIFLGYQNATVIRKYLQEAKALVFPGIEDFGLVPLEAQACGTPVIAFSGGGALETIIKGKTGHFFPEQTSESLAKCIDEFEKIKFDSMECRRNALRFDKKIFKKEMEEFVMARYEEFKRKNDKIL